MLEKGKVVFGNWTVEGEIGTGAFGTVYKIRREEFGKVFYAAMKVLQIPQDKEEHKRLRSEGMDDASISNYYSQIAQDFIKEIELLSSLDGNTNIVDYKDHIIEANEGLGYTIYIKMQLLTPISNTLVNSDGSVRFMENEEIIKLGKDMCSALELCEKKRIIHRDIKIDNIFVSENGDYKLGDFGIARQLEATQGEMSKKGTVLYMAPEVFRGENYDKTVDIYSLGIVLYRLLNKNRAPFFPNYPDPIKFSDKETANARRLKGDVFPDIADISSELNAVLKKACAFNASDRYQSASEFKAALENVSVTPVAPVVVAPVVKSSSDDEATVGAFDVTSVENNSANDGATVGLFGTVPVANNSSDDESTVGAFGTAVAAEAVLSDTFYEKETVTLSSVDDEKTESVFDASPVVNTPVAGGSSDDNIEATVGVFGGAPVAPVATAPIVESNIDDEKTESVFTPAVVPAMTPPVNAGASSTEKKSKAPIIIIIAIILAIGIGVAAFMLFGRNSGGNTGNSSDKTETSGSSNTTITTEAVQNTGEDTTSTSGVTSGAPSPIVPPSQDGTVSATAGYVPPSNNYDDYDDDYYDDDDYEAKFYYYDLIGEYWSDVSYVEDYCYVDFKYEYVYGEDSGIVLELYSYDDWIWDENAGLYMVPGGDLTVTLTVNPDDELHRVFEVYNEYDEYLYTYNDDELYCEFESVTWDEICSCAPNDKFDMFDNDYEFYAVFVGYANDNYVFYSFEDVGY